MKLDKKYLGAHIGVGLLMIFVYVVAAQGGHFKRSCKRIVWSAGLVQSEKDVLKRWLTNGMLIWNKIKEKEKAMVVIC